MIQATLNDKNLIIEILCESFDCNRSVNFVVKQDRKRRERIRILMDYSFELCYRFGKIYLSEDKKACALTLLPDKKQTTLKTILFDAKLAFLSIGFSRIMKVFQRETTIKTHYPSIPVFYLWFMGVMPSEQGKGIGTTLLYDIIEESSSKQRPIYLETSMQENLNFYEKQGFEVYKELRKPHQLYLLRRNLN